MLVHLKGCYTILGKIYSKADKSQIRFNVPLKSKPDIIVCMMLDENMIESYHKREVSGEMWEVLQTDTCDAKDLSPELQAELSGIKIDISEATRKILYLMKYCFYNVELDERLFSVRSISWSTDKSKWKPLPMMVTTSMDVCNTVCFRENTARAIQSYVDDGFQPFFALRHLHRAKKETNPRHKWIDATIAAELAVKEFLVRVKPNIRTLVMEVPSPPMGKMYGEILESFVNQRSPKLKELIKGAEIRNKLIHRPEDTHIDEQQANKYVQDVQIAIYHLLTLLYRSDPIIEGFYKPTIVFRTPKTKK